MGYGWDMRRTAVVVLSNIVISLTLVSPAHSYSKPSDSYDDAVAAALVRFNAADAEYKVSLASFNAADAAWIPLKAASDNAKVLSDLAFAEYKAADAAKWQSLTNGDTATQLAAKARADAANLANLSAFNAWGSARNSASNAQLARSKAQLDLNSKTINRTLCYNVYVEALTNAAKNKIATTAPTKVSTPKTNSATSITNVPIMKYTNCTKLRQTFPKGVAKDAMSARKTGATVNTKAYAANKSYDRDKDGVACELA